LTGAGRAGRARKLSDAQLERVRAALVKGPRENGFAAQCRVVRRSGLGSSESGARRGRGIEPRTRGLKEVGRPAQ
jgi:hypothetical protein